MTSMKQKHRDVGVAEDYCPDFVGIIEVIPDAVADQYNMNCEVARWLNNVEVHDADRSKALSLELLGELAAELPVGAMKTSMEAIAAETAVLATEQSNSEAQMNGRSECWTLIKLMCVWLQTRNGRNHRAANLCLVRAYNEVRAGSGDQNQALLDLMRPSRCSQAQWAGPYTDGP